MKKVYLPRHNQQFCVKAKDEKSAYIPWIGGNLNEILCHQEERIVQNDNTMSYEGLRLQILKDDFRAHYVRTARYISGDLGVFFGNRCLGYYDAQGHLKNEKMELKAA